LNIEYRFGPGFKNTSANTTSIVRLEVNNQLVTKKIRNVIATIRGSHEPDRYILIGNHRDAWTFGGSDPSSGTATLMEISRVLSNLLQDGWRPRRTIKLCSWGGEEFALLGSFEWVEDNDEIFKERAVAYLNTDVAVGGNFVFFAQSSHMLGDLILNHVKKIQDPGDSTKTIFDTMLERLPKSNDYPGEPNIFTFQFSTDNLPFCLYTGLSTADFSYFYGYQNEYNLYPLYHTQYDTFDWIKKFVDPNFRYFKAMAQFLGSMLFDLSDSDILPFSIQRFVRSVQKAYDTLTIPFYNKLLDQSQMLQLKLAKEEFVNMSKTFESAKQKLRGQQPSPLTLRMLNDQIAGLEKTFVSPYSNTNWRPNRKILFQDRFRNIDIVAQQRVNQSEREVRLKFEISLIIRCLRVSTRLLKPLQ
jgi:N-acetylated-alpha-linked acidic dipeptidase